MYRVSSKYLQSRAIKSSFDRIVITDENLSCVPHLRPLRTIVY